MPHGPHYKIRVITCASGGTVGPPSSTRCVAHIINPAIIHEWEKKDGVVTTTNRTFPGVGHQWHRSSVTVNPAMVVTIKPLLQPTDRVWY